MIIQSFVDQTEESGRPLPIYFYCSRNEAGSRRSDPQQILCCLLRQCVESTSRPRLLHILKERYRTGNAAVDFNLNDVVDFLGQAIDDNLVSTVVLDALDECSPQNRQELIEQIKTLLQGRLRPVKIIISSREALDISKTLGTYPDIHIEASRNQDDINSYVEVKIKEVLDRGLLLPGEEVAVTREIPQIEACLRNGAQGM